MNARMTNILLAAILIVSLMNLVKGEMGTGIASPGSVESAVTKLPGDAPSAYLHVVSHSSTEDSTSHAAEERRKARWTEQGQEKGLERPLTSPAKPYTREY